MKPSDKLGRFHRSTDIVSGTARRDMLFETVSLLERQKRNGFNLPYPYIFIRGTFSPQSRRALLRVARRAPE